MAKAQRRATSGKSKTATRGPSKAAAPRGGEGTTRGGEPPGAKLEVAHALSAGSPGARQPATMPRRAAVGGQAPRGTKIPGEAFVKSTETAIPVSRAKATTQAKRPTVPEAIDRRSEVAGSDEAARGKPRVTTGGGRGKSDAAQ